ncbi:hypothetical protein K0M31_010794 [Melipona bicolor]|uniref:Uncharacterized protein n=1 Tax=Melipona bicolor TaxID=60889 RepID=A0AA40FKV9_9HYME|nr:hypothetical protein K0M31_010794 [Melipona bicolor]
MRFLYTECYLGSSPEKRRITLIVMLETTVIIEDIVCNIQNPVTCELISGEVSPVSSQVSFVLAMIAIATKQINQESPVASNFSGVFYSGGNPLRKLRQTRGKLFTGVEPPEFFPKACGIRWTVNRANQYHVALSQRAPVHKRNASGIEYSRASGSLFLDHGQKLKKKRKRRNIESVPDRYAPGAKETEAENRKQSTSYSIWKLDGHVGRQRAGITLPHETKRKIVV